LALVSGRIPQGVVCLLSALAIYELTTQIPRRIDLAVSRTARYTVHAGTAHQDVAPPSGVHN
jgi:predicted transcriptional regulator of viral defense system